MAEINPHPVGGASVRLNRKRRSSAHAASSCASQLRALSSRPWRKCRKQRAAIRNSRAASSCFRTGARSELASGQSPSLLMAETSASQLATLQSRRPPGVSFRFGSRWNTVWPNFPCRSRVTSARPLQQWFRFPRHQLGNYLVVKPRKQFAIARQENGNREERW